MALLARARVEAVALRSGPCGHPWTAVVGGREDIVGSEVDAAEQLCVERDDDGGQAHQDSTDGGWERDAGLGEGVGREGDGDDVVAGGPCKVLAHLAVRGLGESDDTDDGAWVVAGEHDAC